MYKEKNNHRPNIIIEILEGRNEKGESIVILRKICGSSKKILNEMVVERRKIKEI